MIQIVRAADPMVKKMTEGINMKMRWHYFMPVHLQQHLLQALFSPGRRYQIS